MKLLSSLARALVRKDFVESLRQASTPGDVVALVDSVLNPDKPAPAKEPVQERAKTLLAVTACPTGIAHTYMAADSLVAAAKKAGVTLHVETQGSSGSTPLDAVDDRSGRGRHLRHRCRREGQAPLRRQARRRIRCETGDQRTRQDGRRSTCRRGQPERGPRRGRHRAVGTECGTGRRRRLGHPHASDPAHRRELHDPVRRRRWPVDRARIPVRGLRDRELPRWREAFAALWIRLDRPCHREYQLADQPALRRSAPISRSGAVHTRRPGVHVPGTRTRRLHLVRHRRPAGHRAWIHRRRGRRLRRRRVHRRYRRRSHRGLHGTVDKPYRRAAVAPRPDARRDHSVVAHRWPSAC